MAFSGSQVPIMHFLKTKFDALEIIKNFYFLFFCVVILCHAVLKMCTSQKTIHRSINIFKTRRFE
ncbi:MAG TPA: hypothetical protein DEA55_11520 [Rhodospirillaceae bacterium]|nr:hypothetical protein [Rhodospirillaceae bacterium]